MQRSEEAQKAADDARRQAMAMAVLAQTRLAAVRYTLVADEFLIWDEAVRDDDLIVQHLGSSEKAGVDTELELIRARARALASRINRDLSYANLQAAVARLYNSVGYDAVPRDDEGKAVADLAQMIEARFTELEGASFTKRPAAAKPRVAVGTVSGAQPRISKLVAQGLKRALDTAGLSAEGEAEAQLDMRISLDAPRDGVRTARVAVSVLPRGSSNATLAREFRTTLSDPVDDEQWRALGEGAVYRLVSDLSAKRVTQASLRMAERLGYPAQRAPAGSAAAQPAQAAPLPLRLDASIDPGALPVEAGR